nr:HAD-IB family phosphatase [Campylobacter helveticus]
MKEILALFDFCETLTNFQTLDRFLPLVGQYNPNFEHHKNLARREKYQKLNLSYPRYEWLIDLSLNVAQNVAQNFVYDEVLMNLNQGIMNKLFYHQDAGHTLVIVSGDLKFILENLLKFMGLSMLWRWSLKFLITDLLDI